MSENQDEPYNRQDFCLPGPPLNKEDYYFSNAYSDNDAELAGNADINDINNNDVFTYPANMDITKHLDDVEDILEFHSLYLYPKYSILQSYAQGKHCEIIEQDPNDDGKPDARNEFNLPKNLTYSFNGFANGNPVQVSLSSGKDDNDGKTSNDQADKINAHINAYLRKQNLWSMSMRLYVMASIYGRSYLYAYYDDSDPTNHTFDLIPCSPMDTIVVYDDTAMHRPMFAIRYSEDNNNTFSGTLITKKGEFNFNPTGDIGSSSDSSVGSKLTWVDGMRDNKKNDNRVYPKPFPCLPVIEMTENHGRVGIFCDSLSLIDEIDKVESQKANDLLAVSNSYLVIQGVKMTKQQLDQIGQTHVINPYPNDDGIANQNQNKNDINVKFLAPQINDNLQEHVLDRDISQVYQTAQVVDLSDPKSAASVQTATEINNLYGKMEAKANMKNAEFNHVLSQLFQLLFFVWHDDPNLLANLQYHHQLAKPENDLQEAQAYAQLNSSQLPDSVKNSFLGSHVNNNKELAEQMAQNKKQHQQSVASQIKSSLKQINQQQNPNPAVNNPNNQGNNDDNQNSNQKPNKSTINPRQLF